MATTETGGLGVLRQQEEEAWKEYLETTRDQGVLRYEELEPWAWERLIRRLGVIADRRQAIQQDDGA